MFKRFCEDEPIFVVIDIRPGVEGLPTTAYVATEELEVEGKEVHRVFKHLSSSIEAEQAEGVRLLLLRCQLFVRIDRSMML